MSTRMTVEKRILDAQGVRRIHGGFSWIDRRFARDGWIDHLDRDEILLYLFLCLVADKDGLSFYSDARMAATLRVSIDSLHQARSRLIGLGLLAYEAPLHQVLDLETAGQRRGQQVGKVGELVQRIAEGSRVEP